RSLAVRGAPVLGVTAAYAMALAAVTTRARGPRGLLRELEGVGEKLRGTRPTAVNIAWAVDRTLAAARRECRAAGSAVSRAQDALVAEAVAIEREDREACEAIGALGAELVPAGANVLTHCNTGMLCTAGIGTAQGVIWAAHRAGKGIHVWVDETRPVWQGARLTAWELGRLGVPRTLVADAAAASLMAAGRVDLVVVGADRIAADGSVANKIGTYGLAVLAKHHGVPFYVAAPVSTIDLGTPGGADIRIEERDPAEVTAPRGRQVAARGTPVLNPAFDVTPPSLVSAIVTERAVLRKPYPSALRRVAGARRSA
ncbi:MAG: S-methyl-5-thioribose-1-phosphate isomerase, partial [Actinobacteria bacterium]|nr:S-methyl-5-thioribose-1-phosphate isomerase [Actinomycetota bacterium]